MVANKGCAASWGSGQDGTDSVGEMHATDIRSMELGRSNELVSCFVFCSRKEMKSMNTSVMIKELPLLPVFRST